MLNAFLVILPPFGKISKPGGSLYLRPVKIPPAGAVTSSNPISAFLNAGNLH